MGPVVNGFTIKPQFFSRVSRDRGFPEKIEVL
jgi:hypothetical protein